MKLFIMFLIGILECFLLALNTKFLQRDKKLLCFLISFINIFIWYFVISSVVEDLHNLWLIASYALGFALGDVLAIIFDNYLERLAKINKIRIKHKKLKRKRK